MPVTNKKTHLSRRGKALADFDSVAMCHGDEHGGGGPKYGEKRIQSHGGSIEIEIMSRAIVSLVGASALRDTPFRIASQFLAPES